ncbi:type II and III secretion system protein family protein [Vibrio fluvialis]|jgi:pilus assembly protein CpaC|uniref:type II and III secretion system protein family protein n=1 Tax=Vibrio fluvialis TaxID=676 RepID=UPI00192ACB66|nr:type II and III secretion system protein family protein [Vibrio fluvialis]MBL4247580.1 type II and III secretion system protein family protein [Vibrio fluvialis]MBL4256064.1 type II and III secretion system protein family protein [Vibrio fluvialis]MBY8255623.1 type II and III secretion system protein family protein [Vibrio fluvialis]MBY8264029.1 type II and III secretion system protein family protein [Vibrio fluvialis]
MRTIITTLALFFACSVWTVSASQSGETITVPHHKSTFVKLQRSASRVSLGDPQVLDIVMLKSDELFLIGNKLGSTNLMAWDRQGRLIESINIEVIHDVNSLKAKLYEYMPDEGIKVQSSQNRLILSGLVSSQEKMNLALRLAETYAPAKAVDKATGSRNADASATGVVNLMTIGGAQQVMLEVTVAEVQRSLVRRFGANFNFLQSNGNFSIGGTSAGGGISGVTPVFNDLGIDSTGFLSTFMDGNTLFSIALDIAKENGVAKVLAEPNLTALSGANAEFLAGGEFPIPVPNDNGITIEYKEYGVGLKFVPTILSDKKINLKLAVDVSEVASSSALNYTAVGTNAVYYIPPVTRRSASSTIELADGQTIGIAGLLSENTRDSANKMPGLGDIPVLGQLFNSQEYISGQTELVILVTPRLAKPIDRSKITLPTDAFVEPTDLKYYLLGEGAYLAKPKDVKRTKSSKYDAMEDTTKGGSEGSFGHDL